MKKIPILKKKTKYFSSYKIMDEIAIIQYTLGLLSQIKLYHWATMKYSQHKALDKLHEDMSDHIDIFVETYIARFKKQPLKKFKIISHSDSDVSNLIEYLEHERDVLDKMQKHFTKTSELQNILQEMVASIDTSIYLCKLS
jgi:hypothetical protein